MFLEDSDIQDRLAAVLKQDSNALDSYWTATLIPTLHASAYNEIVTKLAARGFTLDQINGWDRGAEFEASISLFWLLIEGAGMHDYSDQAVRALDRRKELETVLVTVGGAEIVPGVVGQGTTIGSGVLNETLQGLQFRYGVGPGNAIYPWRAVPRQIW